MLLVWLIFISFNVLNIKGLHTNTENLKSPEDIEIEDLSAKTEMAQMILLRLYRMKSLPSLFTTNFEGCVSDLLDGNDRKNCRKLQELNKEGQFVEFACSYALVKAAGEDDNVGIARALKVCHVVMDRHLHDDRADGAVTSPFVRACEVGSLKAAKELLRQKADINKGAQITPLMTAAKAGQLEVVRWLLKEGADPTLSLEVSLCPGGTEFCTKDISQDVKQEMTALDFATYYDNDEIAQLISSYLEKQEL